MSVSRTESSKYNHRVAAARLRSLGPGSFKWIETCGKAWPEFRALVNKWVWKTTRGIAPNRYDLDDLYGTAFLALAVMLHEKKDQKIEVFPRASRRICSALFKACDEIFAQGHLVSAEDLDEFLNFCEEIEDLQLPRYFSTERITRHTVPFNRPRYVTATLSFDRFADSSPQVEDRLPTPMEAVYWLMPRFHREEVVIPGRGRSPRHWNEKIFRPGLPHDRVKHSVMPSSAIWQLLLQDARFNRERIAAVLAYAMAYEYDPYSNESRCKSARSNAKRESLLRKFAVNRAMGGPTPEPDCGKGMQRAVARLPEPERTVLTMSHLVGSSQREVGIQTSRSVATVRRILRRAETQLRQDPELLRNAA